MAATNDNATNDLILSAKRGDDNAFTALCTQYANLLAAAAARYETSGIERDELLQSARLSLHKATLTYDGSVQGVTFGLYAKIVVDNAMISLCRHQASLRRKAARAAVAGASSASKSPSQRNLPKTTNLESLSEILSNFETRVLKARATGKTYSEIAMECETDVKSIDNAMTRIRRKARGL